MTVRMLSFFCNLIKVNLVKNHEGLDIRLTKTNIKITHKVVASISKKYHSFMQTSSNLFKKQLLRLQDI